MLLFRRLLCTCAASTHDQEVFSFYPDERFRDGFEDALRCYKELVPQLRFSGPTYIDPVIEMSISIVEQGGGQYHVLLMVADGLDAERYKLGHPCSFHYLNQSNVYELNGVGNAEEYIKTRRAMDIVGIGSEEQEAIFRTLATILHLRNIDFSPGKGHDSSVISNQQSNFHLQMASDILSFEQFCINFANEKLQQHLWIESSG